MVAIPTKKTKKASTKADSAYGLNYVEVAREADSSVNSPRLNGSDDYFEFDDMGEDEKEEVDQHPNQK